MQQPVPSYRQHILNCFSLSEPMHPTLCPPYLLVCDPLSHIYLFRHQPTRQQEGQGDNSLIDTSLQIQEPNGALFGDEVQDQLLFKMDVGFRIAKMWIGGTSGRELLVVGAISGGIKVWVRAGEDSNDYQFSIVDIQSSFMTGNIIDFSIIESSPLKLVLLEGTPDHQLILHRYGAESPTSLQQECPSIKIALPCPCTTLLKQSKLVDSNRSILCGTSLYGIHEQYQLHLDGPESILHVDFLPTAVVYSDGKHVWLKDRNRLNLQSVLVEGLSGHQVVGIVAGSTSRVFVVVTAKPTTLHLCTIKAKILWSIPYPTIQHPLLICCYKNKLVLLDKSNMRCHQVPGVNPLYPPTPILTPQQTPVHSSLVSSLKHRLQLLSTLSAYVRSSDYASVFRYLQNCANNSLLNDGLLFVWAKAKEQYNNPVVVVGVLEAAGLLLQESKYESHLETALGVLLATVKGISGPQGRQSKSKAPMWKQYVQIVGKIVGSKKVQKLQQQDKNRKLFELAYEFVHTANSHILMKY